jgi:hypothetical protein
MPNTDHTGAALADELEREATIEHCGSDIAIGSYLRGRLPAILAALRTPAPVNAEQPEGVERKYAQRLKDYKQWFTEQDPLSPEDEGREVEFAFGDGWRLGYDAALAAAKPKETGSACENCGFVAQKGGPE